MLLSSKDSKITNIQGKPLRRLLDAILDVDPNLIQLEVPQRPPSESFVRLPSLERIKLITQDLTEALGKDNLVIYGIHDKRGKQVTWFKHE